MQTLARTQVAALSIFVIIFAIAPKSSASLTDEANRNEAISHNCIDDATDECHETEMHPNVPHSRREMKSQWERTTDYWLQQGVQHVLRKSHGIRAAQQAAVPLARNIIFFIGDGMSLATLAATRLYHLGGEEQSLSFERFSHTGLARTYALDRLVPDSAAAATALLCGVKTKHGLIGLDGKAKRGCCDSTSTQQSQLTSIAAWAMEKQKWAGFVTTTRVTDATPAALYAHSSERMWENDADLKKVCGLHTQMEDIGLQLMNGTVGARLKLVLGGGSAQLVHKQNSSGIQGLRSDGRNLIEEFKAGKENIFVSSKSDPNWLNMNLTKNGRLLGLFSADHLPYHLETARAGSSTVPRLVELTSKAIEVLSKNERGFFLLVEAGKIDLAHHENKARLAIDETAELDKAVAKALQMTNKHETLIVVTADHGHTMSLAGYACRSSDIFGISNGNAADGLPYKVLSYANGPSFNHFRDEKSKKRLDLNGRPKAEDENKRNEKSFEMFPATAPLAAATHGGEDVPVFANGPWSHLFSGVYDQSTIPHLMAFAGCLDKHEKACRGA